MGIGTEFHSTGLKHGAKWLMPLAALALLFSLSIPARAGDERAVKVRVAPAYPEIAKRMRITGEVKLAVTVDAEGRVTDVKEVSGFPLLGGRLEYFDGHAAAATACG